MLVLTPTRDGIWQEGEKRSLAMAAAEGVGVILKDSDVCLNKAHHAIIRPLYKQRFFSSMLSPLLEAVRSSSDTQVK
jgi:DNA repair/transcription protein MET18/MMS19